MTTAYVVTLTTLYLFGSLDDYYGNHIYYVCHHSDQLYNYRGVILTTSKSGVL